MPNTSSAKKAVRKIQRRALVNRDRRSRVRTFVRKAEEAIGEGSPEAARSAFRLAEKELMRASQRGILPKNRASRKTSRLARQLSRMSA